MGKGGPHGEVQVEQGFVKTYLGDRGGDDGPCMVVLETLYGDPLVIRITHTHTHTHIHD